MTLPSIPRHDTGDAAPWRDRLVHVQKLSAGVMARAPAARDATELLRDAVRFIQSAAVVPGTAQEVAPWIERGALAARTAVLLQRSFTAGEAVTVELNLAGTMPGAAPRAMPVGETTITWVDWVHGFALAALARDRLSLGILCTPNSVAACGESADTIDPLWGPLCETLAAAWRDDPAALQEATQEAAAAMDAARIMDADQVNLTLRPLLPLAQALVARDAAAYAVALTEALQQFHRYWSVPERRQDHLGFLALPAAGLAALARDRGLALPLASDYLPAATAGFDRAWAAPAFTVRFAPRAIVKPDEARWFLDLAGYPREARRHQIVERDGQLVAHYEMSPTAVTAAATVDFVMLEAGQRPSVPLALDPGQLLWLAEVYASGSPTRASLSDAIAAADAALARFEPQQERLTAPQFPSPLGRELWEHEPGRFSHARLRAYRDALAAALQRRDAEHAAVDNADTGGETLAANDAIASALSSVGEIQTLVTPMLEALRGPQGAEVLRALQPQPGDAEAVCADARAAALLRAASEAAWAEGDTLFSPPQSGQTALRVFVAPAGMLADDNLLSRHFPSGYRAVAALLDPHRIWVCWKYTRPNESSGLAYDGLVWCDDHWAWFPKPYRALAAIVADLPDQPKG